MKRLIGSALALALLGGTAAMAQSGSPAPLQGQAFAQNRQPQGPQDRGNHDGNAWTRGAKAPHDTGNHRDWARGDRLPGNYGESRYAVQDWRAHNLRRPPRGYHWVRDDNNDFLLAAVATGVIADIVLHNH